MEFLKEGQEEQFSENSQCLKSILSNQVTFIENQMRNLKKDCVSIYAHHMYHCIAKEYHCTAKEYEEISNRIQEQWQQICAYSWKEHTQILNIFKIKANCFVGCVYACTNDFDKALSCLIQAMNLIEVNALQYTIPEFYVFINIRIAECHREKHSFRNHITDCLKKADKILEEKSSVIKEKYFPAYVDKLYLDIRFQEMYTDIDNCCTTDHTIKDQKDLDAEAEKHLEKLEQLLQKKYAKNSGLFPEVYGFCYNKWINMQRICFFTSRGEFRKNQYFALLHKNEEKDRFDDADTKKQLELLEKAFCDFNTVLKADNLNTISMNGMAALLYSYDRSDMNNKDLAPVIDKYCMKFKHMTVKKTIENLIDQTLKIERTNMFALSIKGALKYASDFPKKIDNYPALRQSSLKKWFIRLEKIYLERKSRTESCETFINIETALIHLYSQINDFMKSAVIDFEDNDWKDLKIGHYTKMAVLPKLLRKESGARMRMYNVHHLNDPLEGAILINHLKKNFPEEGKEEGKTAPLIQDLWKMYDFDCSGAVRNSVYMGSFTCRLDKLNMWEQYGDHLKGIALQLNAREFFDREPEISLEELSTNGNYGKYKRENVRYPLYMVTYLPSVETCSLKELDNKVMEKKKAAEKNKTLGLEDRWQIKQWDLIHKLYKLEIKIKTSLAEIQNEFEKLDKELQCDMFRQELCNTIMVILDLVRFLIKSDFYQDEREFRVIQYSADPECELEGMDVPNLYIPIEKELKFEKIYFGPLVTCFESKAAYPLNIKRDCQDNVIEVRKSEILFKEE